MQLSMWPNRSLWPVVRLVILAASLLLVAFTAAELRLSRPDVALQSLASAVRSVPLTGNATAETRSPDAQAVQLRLQYGWDLANQLKVADAAVVFWRRHASIPASAAELGKQGVPPSFQRDPWGRQFLIRAVAPDLVVVQSTGPAGGDRVPWDDPSALSDLRANGFQVVGGSILIARKIRRPALEQSTPPTHRDTR
jgi:hypothetical protein